MNPDDKTALEIMRSGEIRTCEEARQKWVSGKYCDINKDEKMYRENLKRWYGIEQRIQKLSAELYQLKEKQP